MTAEEAIAEATIQAEKDGKPAYIELDELRGRLVIARKPSNLRPILETVYPKTKYPCHLQA